MEIKKLDREKADKEVKKKAVPPSKKKTAPKKEKKQYEDEALKKIGTGKIITYSVLMIVIVAASATYNYFAYQKATQPLRTEKEMHVDLASNEFYELCDDIEFYKEEYGEYPDAIDDMMYSDNLEYIRTSTDSFRLIYDDGKNHFAYDSTSDFDELR